LPDKRIYSGKMCVQDQRYSAEIRKDAAVNYPIAEARGLHLRSKVPRRHQEEPHAAHSLPGSHREAG